MPKRATKKRAVLFAGLACAWLLLACASALAHANLVEASPPPGGEVSKPPERIELHFNEPVDAEFFTGRSAYLCDPEGNYFEITWTDAVDNPVVVAARRAAGLDGRY